MSKADNKVPDRIGSVDQFFQWLKEVADPRLRFRGVPKACYDLTPAIDRKATIKIGYSLPLEKWLLVDGLCPNLEEFLGLRSNRLCVDEILQPHAFNPSSRISDVYIRV